METTQKDFNTIAVIYASEGTGHRTAAQALCEAFLAERPNGRALCLDVLDFIPPAIKFAVSEGYVAMARYAPWMWGAFYWGSDHPGAQSAAFEGIYGLLCRAFLPRLQRLVEREGVQALVFTHYFGAAEMAAREAGRMPVFCVDTDFESHSFQRRQGFAWSFAGSPRAVTQRRNEGIFNVSDLGVPIAGKFSRLPEKAAAREALNIPQDRRVVLVSGGGIGAGAVARAAASLSRRGGWTSVIVCGNNKKLYARLKSYYRYKENVRVEGFVGNMEELYAAADCAVMKPGGLSASEALCAGLPMLLIDPVPGQEELNMAWLTSQGAALTLVRPERAAESVDALFTADGAKRMREAALALARPEAARNIIARVSEFI